MTDVSAAAALWRFFSGFSGYGVPLGFEVMPPGGGIPAVGGAGGNAVDTDESNGIMGAVFSMSPSVSRAREYINGDSVLRGGCTVSLLSCDCDRASRMRMASVFAALCEYTAENGEFYRDTETGKTYRIRAVSSPVRMIAYADRVVWEMNFSFEEYD
ncbi:MAG: hypothetical protein IJ449_10280 [Clostridia bacterium]|nr:hypothetical protein [Clostridia bacterium]